MQGLEPPARTFQAGDTALIIGAGLAGCAVANVLASQGFKCRVFDSSPAAARETSSVPVAIYRPYLSIGHSIVNAYFSCAFSRIVSELRTIETHCFQSNGLLQLVTDKRSWQDGQHHRVLSAKEVSEKANRRIHHPALFIPEAGSLVPSQLCRHWLSHKENIALTTNTTVHHICKTSNGWELTDNNNAIIGEGQFIVLANGIAANQLSGQQPLPLTPISGQISQFCMPNPPAPLTPIIENKGYAVPTDNGYWIGATHHRNCSNKTLSQTDDQLNLALLSELAETTGTVTSSWAGVRCATPDRLPLIGGIADSDFFSTAYHELHHGRKHQKFPPAQHIDGLYITAGMGSGAPPRRYLLPNYWGTSSRAILRQRQKSTLQSTRPVL